MNIDQPLGIRILLFVLLVSIVSPFCSTRIISAEASLIDRDSLRSEIGRHLFYDKRLSLNGMKSCSSCHDQRYAFSDGYRTSLGAEGVPLKRNAPGLFNLESLQYFTWADSRITSLESQMKVPLFNEHPVEMGFTKNEEQLKDFLNGDTFYSSHLSAAFPGMENPFTIDEVKECIVEFMLQFRSLNSPYDQYVSGKTDLNNQQLRGRELFFSDSLGCRNCHAGIYFSNAATDDSAYFNTGTFKNVAPGGIPDSGLYEVTRNPADIGKYRVPSLRNLAYTAPYMHNGDMRTLTEVVEHYVHIGHQAKAGNLSARLQHISLDLANRQALVSFLLSLSDSSLIANTRLSDPFKP